MLPVSDLNFTVHSLTKHLGTVCGADHQSHHATAAPPVLCIIPVFCWYLQLSCCKKHTPAEGASEGDPLKHYYNRDDYLKQARRRVFSQCHTRSEVQDKRPIKLFCYLYLSLSERQIKTL